MSCRTTIRRRVPDCWTICCTKGGTEACDKGPEREPGVGRGRRALDGCQRGGDWQRGTGVGKGTLDQREDQRAELEEDERKCREGEASLRAPGGLAPSSVMLIFSFRDGRVLSVNCVPRAISALSLGEKHEEDASLPGLRNMSRAGRIVDERTRGVVANAVVENSRYHENFLRSRLVHV